jgi:ATP-dependent protease HslVU (ClpYQ) peptidase subunit
MTVVVALKSGDYLQPRGRLLQFEPGIVMAGDTRLSYLGRGNRPAEDDHAKVDSIGDFAIAGYAGNRDIATSVLSRLEGAIVRAEDFSPRSIASIAQSMLVDDDLRNRHLQPKDRQVQILLGIRDPKTKNFVLYEMATDNGFELQPRDGMAAIGSHGHYVKEMFDKVRRIAAQLPSDPFKGPEVTLRENLAPFVWFLLDKAIETAAEVEGTGSLIGGGLHLVVLHSRGVEAMDPDDNVRLRL